MTIEFLEKVDSTNKYIEKFIKKRQNAIVRAKRQTAGLGTKGRTFISEEGGVYFTKLQFYQGLKAENAFSVMINSAMAVVCTLEAYGIKAGIKWPNDIIVNGKKICGILINNVFSGELVDYSIVGIGLNVNNQLANEIKDIATSMQIASGKNFDENGVFFTLIQNLQNSYSVSDYENANLLLNKTVSIIRDDSVFEAIPERVLPDGRLLLKGGEILSAGEIDLKILLKL